MEFVRLQSEKQVWFINLAAIATIIITPEYVMIKSIANDLDDDLCLERKYAEPLIDRLEQLAKGQ
jgi:hypothetical protein